MLPVPTPRDEDGEVGVFSRPHDGTGSGSGSDHVECPGGDGQPNTEAEMDAYLRRKYGVNICEVEVLEREDLDLKNHLSGLKRKLIKVR